MLIVSLFCMTIRFFRSTLLLIPDLLDQSSMRLYPSSFYFCVDRVLKQFKQSKKDFVMTSLHDLEKK